ncbi:MAG: hypothetical protein PHD13_05050 [Methanocellales archaeon]|nr:hypothetical protein [Methanocellales archaeon]MDD3291876.1 hypothetical protein [Methanocellales archaeon]MDD5235519.1 hypothetical protein [Methanocellales archaeon]MDD5485138.1 hypothetical protein [Methanocellales archaeon]
MKSMEFVERFSKITGLLIINQIFVSLLNYKSKKGLMMHVSQKI